MRSFVARSRAPLLLSALLILPLTGGLRMAGTAGPAPKKCSDAAAPATATAVSALIGGCWQDQFGNQYNLTNVDADHHYIYGTVTNVQGCEGTTWDLLGTYLGPRYEFTAVNPFGDYDPNCVPDYVLKGHWPNGSWFYNFGYGDQSFTFTACAGAKPIANPLVGGARRPTGG